MHEHSVVSDRGGKATPFEIGRIELMVRTFYGRVQADALLGPVFDARIVDWEPHLARMVHFWRAVLRAERTFTVSPRGGPPTLHRAIAELTVAHFDRWLAIFCEVADQVFDSSEAVVVKRASERIAAALSRHLTSPSVFEVRGDE